MAAPSRKTVLLVEDDPDVRDAVHQVLSDEGYAVVAAHDGADALRRLEPDPSRFCTVILDVLMPGLDGAEFLVLARDRLADVPVLLFSASRLSPELLRDPRVVDYIPKPVNLEVLLAKIRAHCG